MKTSSSHGDKKEQAGKMKDIPFRQMQQLKDIVQYQQEKISQKEYGACCMATD